MGSLDDEMRNLEEREVRDSGEQHQEQQDYNRISIGKVEHFFDRVGVAAITLTGSLRVGDVIEIDSGEEMLRQKVESMQIERVDVNEASSGDSVGIKTERPVARGSEVYRIQ